MKILFFTENFPPETNAAATRVYERAVYWAKWGHEVTVITCQPNFPYGKLFDGFQNAYAVGSMSNIKVVRVKTFIAANRGIISRVLDFLSFMVMGYLAARKETTPDVVVSTSPQFFAAVAAWWFAKRRGLKYVFELGDLWPASIAAVGAMKPNLGLRLIEKLELKMYRDADAVVALTKSFKDNLISRHIPAEKIAVVINGVDLWRYGPRPKNQDLASVADLPKNAFVIGYVGTHGMAHALDNVLSAASKLQDHSDIIFLFVGAGAERAALMARALTENLTNVRFMPPQPKDAMPEVWSLCDVALVHLKDSDVFAGVIPSKIFEAMSMGLPILFAGPAGEASHIIEASEAGLVVAAENPDDLAKAAIVFCEDKSVRESASKKSHAAADQHSRETQARAMMDVLEDVVSKPASIT